jgi:hypothetical protein
MHTHLSISRAYCIDFFFFVKLHSRRWPHAQAHLIKIEKIRAAERR